MLFVDSSDHGDLLSCRRRLPLRHFCVLLHLKYGGGHPLLLFPRVPRAQANQDLAEVGVPFGAYPSRPPFEENLRLDGELLIIARQTPV